MRLRQNYDKTTTKRTVNHINHHNKIRLFKGNYVFRVFECYCSTLHKFKCLFCVNVHKAGWCRTTCTEQLMQWIDDNVKFSALHLYKKRADPSEGKESKPKQSTRKYVCPCCGLIVRATKDCRISCMDCNEETKLESELLY